MNETRIVVLKVALSLALLTISFVSMLLSIEQSKRAAVIVDSTYQLLNLSKSIQTASFDHKDSIRLYLQTGHIDAFEQMNQSRQSILDDLSRMQSLLARGHPQAKVLQEIVNDFHAVVNEAGRNQPDKGGLIIKGPTISIVAEGGIDLLNEKLIEKLRDFDSALQKISQDSQQIASFRTLLAEIIMLFSLVAGIGVLLLTLKALRKEVEQRESAEERWRFALEGAGEGVWDWDLSKDKTYYSKRWGEILGLDENEVGSSLEQWGKHIHPEDKPGVDAAVKDYFDGKVPAYFSEYRVLCNDGSCKWVRERGQVSTRNKNGAPLRMIGTLEDVTERKMTRTALEEREHLLKNLLNVNPDLIWLKDVNGIYMACNERFEKFFGHPASKIIGKTDYDFVSKELADFFREHDRKAMLSAKPSVNEEWITFADDQHSELLETTKIAMFDAQGKMYGVLGIGHDITERKRAEDELRIAATVFESQEGMIVTDANNVILRVNKAFTSITGYSAEEAIGNRPNILNSGRQDAEFYKAMWDDITHKGAWEGEIWNRRKSGEVYPEHLAITAVKDIHGVVSNYVATLTDITMSKAASEEIKSLAFFDPLTKLPNRRLMLDRLRQAMASSARSGQRGAVLFLDLDHFKTLNDTSGHDVGDLLLRQVAGRLKACVREGDTIARIGGDEFVVLLEDLDAGVEQAAAQTEAIANKILHALNQPYLLASYEYHSTISIGVTIFHDHDYLMDELLKQADIAMYQAKTGGRNTLRFFDPAMQEAINQRVDLERELRNAITAQQFQLHYQIQVDNSGHALGAEVLIRWRHPELGMVPPNKFIPLAEDTGLILQIGQWVLETACAQLKVWKRHASTRHLTLSVNVSVKQFRQQGFAEQVEEMVARYGINPMLLKLELTESILLDNLEAVIAIMNRLKKLKIYFSLDDFGTGYSSLQYLKNLPIYQLKIDQSFVRDIVEDVSDQAIVRTIIAMAHTLNLNVIAEGVETEEQRQLLINNGCQTYQGYLFGKPMPIREFEKVLSDN